MEYSTLIKISIGFCISCLFLLYLYNRSNFLLEKTNFITFNENLFKYSNNVPDKDALISRLKSITNDLELLHRNENNILNSPLAEKIQTPNYLFELNKTTTCYEIDNKPVIWIYWDKVDKIPVFGRILLDSIQCVNFEFKVIIVHDSTLNDFWPDCPLHLLNKLVPAHRADVIRVNLIKRFGGIYLDIDTFPLESFYMYYEMLKDYDLIGGDWQGIGPIAMGFLGPARANHPFFNVWSLWQLECMRKVINNDSKSDPFGWPELLAWMAGPLADHMMRNKVLKFYGYRGHLTVGQLITRGLAHGLMVPLSNISYHFNNFTETPILFMHHAGAAKRVDGLNFTDLMFPEIGHTVFTYFVKCAINQCYNNTDYFRGSSLTEIGKLPTEDYANFIDTNPLPYSCYEFNHTIIPKIVKPK